MELNEQQVIEDYYKLRSCRAVSEKYGCSSETIRRILKRNGIKLTGWKRPPKKEPNRRCPAHITYTDEEVINAYLRLGTQDKVSDELGISHTTVYRILKRNNIQSTGRQGNHGGGTPSKITDEQLIKACETMTRQEIADNYGMHIASVDRRMSKLGVHALPADNSFCDRKGNFGDCWHFVESQWRKFEALHPGFEYLETRKAGGTARIRLKCKKCGTIIERAGSTLREKQIRCEQCEADRKLNEARQSVAHVINAIAFSLTPRICKHCGKTFTSANPYQIYCSKKCIRKSKGNSIRRRCRKYGVYYDPSVKSELVFKRDGMVCQICGKKCDPMDHIWGDTGPLYPSVDHIIPLAKGGTHTWGNVQTAHIICNSFKRDLLEEEANCG